MKVAVFGLGYVGCVSATCLAEIGHNVTGVDVSAAKVAQINEGTAPIVEPQLAETLARVVAQGRLRATIVPEAALAGAEAVLICVGTPSAENGSLDYRQLHHVAEQLASSLHVAAPRPVVAIRSTVMAATVLQEILPRLEQHGARAGREFDLCVNPEFLREGSAVRDFRSPPITLIGELGEESGARLACLYQGIDAPVVRVDLKTASMIKYASNAFHALKIVFANEIGVVCESLGADSQAVMDVFCRDTKLNVSPAYLRPGFAFGGSCLPKDLRAILYSARHADADVPVLNTILRSNELHVRRAVDAIVRSGLRRVGMVGLSFKANTDDLRESPLVTVVEQLIGRGYNMRVFDAEVNMSRVFGRNREYIDRTIPHITSLMSDSLDDLIATSELIVVGKRFEGIEAALERRPVPGQVLVDLARLWAGSVTHLAGRPIVRIN
jgi:GDP-mannose 6-dehydrogenase